MDKKEINERTGLRETECSIVTEEKLEFLGLPSGLIYLPMGAFAIVNVLCHNFILGLVVGLTIFAIFRYWLRGKPHHFLKLWIWHHIQIRKFRFMRHWLSDL